MKRLVCVILVMVLAFGLAACSGQSPEKAPEPSVGNTTEPTPEPSVENTPEPAPEIKQEVIVFNDPILEMRVREIIGKPEGDITVEEALAVEVLDVSNKDNDPNGSIKDISALKAFSNLKVLYISLNNISDISAVAGMKNLEAFYSMNGNGDITDFTPLAGLTNMLDLSILDGKNINDSNIGFINDMTSLEMLWISDAPELTDISVVSNFKNLWRLNINNTGVSDISPVAGLSNLACIDLSGTKVSDISPLKELTNLTEYLKLNGCPIKDFSPIKDIYLNIKDKDFEMK